MIFFFMKKVKQNNNATMKKINKSRFLFENGMFFYILDVI